MGHPLSVGGPDGEQLHGGRILFDPQREEERGTVGGRAAPNRHADVKQRLAWRPQNALACLSIGQAEGDSREGEAS